MSLIIVLLLIYYSPLLVRVVVLLLLKVHAELLDLELVEIGINRDDIRSQATDLILSKSTCNIHGLTLYVPASISLSE